MNKLASMGLNYNGTAIHPFTYNNMLLHEARMEGIRKGKIAEISIHRKLHYRKQGDA